MFKLKKKKEIWVRALNKNSNLKMLPWIIGGLIVLIILLLIMKPTERYYLENHKDYSSYKLDFYNENLLVLLAKAPILETATAEDDSLIISYDATFFDDYVPEDVQIINVTSSTKYIIIEYYKGSDFVTLGYENNKLSEMLIQNETKNRIINIYNDQVTVSKIN